MYVLLTILIIIAAVLLTLLVLVQNSKGGGLAAGFSSGNQVMGAPKTADFLEKASWTLIAVTLAGIIIALSIIAVGFNKSEATATEEGSAITEQVQEAFEAEQAAQAVPEFEGAEEPIAE